MSFYAQLIHPLLLNHTIVILGLLYQEYLVSSVTDNAKT